MRYFRPFFELVAMVELFDSHLTGPVLRTFVEYLITFCSRTDAASEVISGRFLGQIVLDKPVKFGGRSLNCSREILPKAVVRSIFDSFFTMTSDGK